MNSPRLPAITLNACLLVGCTAILVLRSPSHAEEPVANPIGGGASVRLEPAPPPERPLGSRSVFVCHAFGHVIYSDRPCGPMAQRQVVKTASPSAGEAASTAKDSPAAATRPKAEPSPNQEAARAAPSSRCSKLREQLETLDDRMRAGYSAREAARLWNRWRDVNSEIYAARCGRSDSLPAMR
jgi:hypothetical protein